MSQNSLLKLGTRGSPLALAQADELRRRLAAAHPALAAEGAVEIVVIRTTGDRIQDRKLSEIGGKGLFTKELDEALADRRIDVAVHSMKDVPTWLPEDMALDCLLPREDPRDAFFGRAQAAPGLAGLPKGGVVGTASLRRQAQVLAARPDLEVVPLRGNVQTRLSKLAQGQVDATFLAVAGLNRLGQAELITAAMAPEVMLPAVGQGAIGLQQRRDDRETADWLAPLHDAETGLRVAAERACLAVLDGSCRTPIAGFAELDAASESGGAPTLRLRALVAMPDGSNLHRDEERAPLGGLAQAEALGRKLGERLRATAGEAFFAALAEL